MPRINDHPLPAEIAAEFRRMLLAAPEEAVLAFAKGDPVLERGFRPGSHRSVEAVRRRIVEEHLDRDRNIEDALLGILALGDPLVGATITLSPETIEEAVDALMAIHSRSRTLAALLVDYRQEVRELAFEILDDQEPAEDLKVQDARELMGNIVAPLMGCMLDWLERPPLPEGAGPAAPSSVPPFEGLAKLQARIAELEKELAGQKEQGRHEKALQKKIEEQRQQIQRLENNLRQAGRETEKEQRVREELKAEMARLRERHADLERSLAERVRSGVEQELHTLRNRWLQRPLEIERAAAAAAEAAAAHGDILERAADALRRQAETDRHSGNLGVLRRRLAALEEMQRGVQTARREALHPLPALQAVEDDLAAELARLRRLVPGAPREDGGNVMARLTGQINAASSADEVVRLQNLLETIGEAQLLDPADLQKLYRGCHERLERVYAAFTPGVVKKDVRLEDPVWRLRNAVEENENLVVLLDGHNVVFALTGLLGESYENGEAGAVTRQRLMDLVLRVFQRAPKCRVEVIFDGPDAARKRRAENVFETYSGGEGEHRADRALLEQIEYLSRTMSAVPRLLVTDDRELRAFARERSTRIMPVPQFGAFLEEMLE